MQNRNTESLLPSSGRKQNRVHDPTQASLHHLASTPDQDETPPKPWAPVETWSDPEVTTAARRTGDSEGCPLQSAWQMITKLKICSLELRRVAKWATYLRQCCLLRDHFKYSAMDSQILTRLKGEDRHFTNKVNYSTGWWIIQLFNNLNQCEDC